MIYIVTGRHRTGTSMMVRAISESSKLTPFVDMDSERLIRSREKDASYNPNPNGYYQSNLVDLTDLPNNTIVKVGVSLFGSPKFKLPNEYTILQMVRDETERKQSFARSFDGGEMIYLYEQGERSLLENHNPTTISYAKVVSKPDSTFYQLKKLGYPIDVAKAVTFVDKSLYRNKNV